MNEKVKSWLILGGISLVTISSIYLLTKPKRKSAFKSKLVNLANEEFDAWNKNGKIKEGNQDTLKRLRNYWEIGSKTKQNDNYYINTAWSATFISYLMREAGAGDDFRYAPSHSRYIAQSVKNRKENRNLLINFRSIGL